MTQKERIIAYMLRRYPQKLWFRMSDFQGPDTPREFFVGYKTTARINELENDYPGIFAKRDDPEKPRFVQRRLRFDNLIDLLDDMGDEWREFIRRRSSMYGVDLEKASEGSSQDSLMV